jgi:alanine dehydrogenase
MPNVIGVPKEIKPDENRVAIAPSGVHYLTERGHVVLIEKGAGFGSGIGDAEFRDAGATLVDDAREVWDRSGVVVKVKEPVASEYGWIRRDQVLFTFFHFAASRELTLAMIQSGAICLAYETLRDSHDRLPILTPMSEVAGRMAVIQGAKYLERPSGGRGILISGVPGVEPAKVVILGGGVVGQNAALIAAGLGAQVTVLDVNADRLRYLYDVLPPNVTTLYSNPFLIAKKVRQADLVIGAVLIAGAKAPLLVRREDVENMKDGSVVVDVAVDQGGCIETSRPTTHSDPTFVEAGVVHYCVANMPGAVARTSTFALTNVTLPYVSLLAEGGVAAFLDLGAQAAEAVNIIHGKVCHQGVAQAFGLEFRPLSQVFH